jgi:hypothetical protein
VIQGVSAHGITENENSRVRHAHNSGEHELVDAEEEQ